MAMVMIFCLETDVRYSLLIGVGSIPTVDAKHALGNWMQPGLRSWDIIGSSPIGRANFNV